MSEGTAGKIPARSPDDSAHHWTLTVLALPKPAVLSMVKLATTVLTPLATIPATISRLPYGLVAAPVGSLAGEETPCSACETPRPLIWVDVPSKVGFSVAIRLSADRRVEKVLDNPGW